MLEEVLVELEVLELVEVEVQGLVQVREEWVQEEVLVLVDDSSTRDCTYC